MKYYTNHQGLELYKNNKSFQVWSDWFDPEENLYEVKVNEMNLIFDEGYLPSVPKNTKVEFIKLKENNNE